MNKRLYDLEEGEKFILNNKTFTVVCWIRKFMPTIGKVPNLKAIDENGKTQLFFRNINVSLVTQE